MSDVCLSVAYIGNNSRTERPRKTKIGIQVAHVTRDSDTTLKVKGHQAGLLTSAFTHRELQRSALETAATLPSAGAAVGSATRGATTPTRGEGRGGGILCVATRTACLGRNAAARTQVGLRS